MRATYWIVGLWPGLSQAWLFGQWRGLVLAVAFSVAFNFALLQTFLWPAWTEGLPAIATWLLVLGLWVVGLRSLYLERPRLARSVEAPTAEMEQWFREAQREYLKGHWIEAETLVARMLAVQPADREAKLLRASIERRTRRWEAARATLLELKQTSIDSKWRMEIEEELRQIAELENEETDRGPDVLPLARAA